LHEACGQSAVLKPDVCPARVDCRDTRARLGGQADLRTVGEFDASRGREIGNCLCHAAFVDDAEPEAGRRVIQPDRQRHNGSRGRSQAEAQDKSAPRARSP
jgi:hypothetical protein